MKTIKSIVLIVLVSFAFLTSCRTEDDMTIDPPVEQSLEANSALASLMSQTSLNDGSNDNIIDNASCFSVELPVTVVANGTEVVVTSTSDYDVIEDIFDADPDDTDTLEIVFPITVIFADYTTASVNSYPELLALIAQCPEENAADDDIECIDFQYPITASVFDENNEIIETITINNDNQLYDFIEDLDEYVAVTINFPITVILADGGTVTVNSIAELQSVIEEAEDSCDEDDDNDYNDDDCDNCTTDDLENRLVDCSPWSLDDLEVNDVDYGDQYENYTFDFTSDGAIMITGGGTTYVGTWSAMGDANNIQFDIEIPSLPAFNGIWNLHEIEQEGGETELEFEKGDDDELSFESDCVANEPIDDQVLVDALTNGDWYVTYFFDDEDETADFADYTFNFSSDNTATAVDSNGATTGSWFTSPGDQTELSLNLNFGTMIPLDELQDDWDVLEVTNDIIRLGDLDDNDNDFLTFERTPFDGGGGNNNLETILIDGLWFVASYVEDTDDQTSTYAGYELDFEGSGVVTASNGNNTNNGTWMVLGGGNLVALNFGTAMPFEEFNDDDWDVISFSENEVVLQDVSGGNGDTDILTLQKI